MRVGGYHGGGEGVGGGGGWAGVADTRHGGKRSFLNVLSRGLQLPVYP